MKFLVSIIAALCFLVGSSTAEAQYPQYNYSSVRGGKQEWQKPRTQPQTPRSQVNYNYRTYNRPVVPQYNNYNRGRQYNYHYYHRPVIYNYQTYNPYPYFYYRQNGFGLFFMNFGL